MNRHQSPWDSSWKGNSSVTIKPVKCSLKNKGVDPLTISLRSRFIENDAGNYAEHCGAILVGEPEVISTSRVRKGKLQCPESDIQFCAIESVEI